jgi:protein gp37
MSANSKIEWTDHTFNPWIGCTKVSIAATGGGGCDHCYAEVSTPARVLRSKGDETWGARAPRVRTSEANWKLPRRWNAQHEAFFAQHGRRQRVFCASLADVFDNAVDPMWRSELFILISETPNLDWLLLTKRIGNVQAMLPVWYRDPAAWEGGNGRAHANVWIGATVVNQAEADRDIPKLLDVPAAKRFLSMEPLLGPVDLQKSCTARCPNGDCFPHSSGHRVVVDSESGGLCLECICSRLNGLHWVIVGGESGPGARPMHPDWARALRDQCAAAGVPFLFKQWGEWLPALQDGDPNASTWEVNASDSPIKVGKKAAGRLLDGRTHDKVPA